MFLWFITRQRFFFFFLFFLITSVVKGQQWIVSGVVKNMGGESISAATVSIEGGKTALCNEDGKYSITVNGLGKYKIQVRHIAYQNFSQDIEVNSPSTISNFVLDSKAGSLKEITVYSKSVAESQGEQPIKAEVISTRAAYQQPSTLIELMNRAPGVRIRQTGGLGSSSSLSVNGFQDKAIKYFRDGIPMDYLGAGYSIALVPVNMLERVEIYKGVLPMNLGADALGGGVEMISRKSVSRYAELSCETASFGTYRAALNGFYNSKSNKIFVGIESFFNHSDNNYNVTAKVTDPELSTQVDKKVRLYHNQFTHYYTEVYGGFRNAKWADELRVSLTGFHIDRDNQYGTKMEQPFGASTSRQSSLIPTLRYKKGTFGSRLQLDQFLVANTINVKQIDTAGGQYDWSGNFTPASSRRGEIETQGALSSVKFSYFTSRTHLSWQLNPEHKLELNTTFINLGRKGSDPYGAKFVTSGQDILITPARYHKVVAALGVSSSFFNSRVSNNLFVKYFQYTVDAYDGDYWGNEKVYKQKNQNWGLGEAIKFKINPNAFFRFSGEWATRLPEQGEIFGDGNLYRSNFGLKPERSLNMNAGFRLSSSNRYTFEVNSFYRITKDLILKVPVDLLFTESQNVESVKGIGNEVDASIHINKFLKVNGNFTYQDFGLLNTGNQLKEGARLRNTPYFFANLGADASVLHILNKKDNLQLYWYYTFVREYYLDYIPKEDEPGGLLGLWGRANFNAPNIIPNQNLHSTGFTYKPGHSHFSLGFQVKNVFNSVLYDNFRIQNAGRSLHLKLNYTIK